MRVLWKEKAYGWWSVTGLLGKDWFFGFSRKPPSPAQAIPPATDPRTPGVKGTAEPHPCRWFNGRCIDCGRAYGEPRNAGEKEVGRG